LICVMSRNNNYFRAHSSSQYIDVDFFSWRRLPALGGVAFATAMRRDERFIRISRDIHTLSSFFKSFKIGLVQ